MANPDHLAILAQGIEIWNRWRRELTDIADLCQADLRRANLAEANLAMTHLNGAVLSRANLSAANLILANLSGAKLVGAELFGADLSGADLCQGDLTGANLINANLNAANLTDTNLGKSTFGRTLVVDTDLRTARGLETIKHHRPSTIGIDTIFRSEGKIPQIFLRRAGVPGTFITHMKALVGAMEPIHFYSCFISYSTRDQDFADRLYADLQQKAVRCWLATEDLKIGEKFRSRIDESIRLHDRLLLVLSKKSIVSAWVEEEVEAALERERRENRLVLFPIRIDDSVMQTDVAWAASLRRTRHIGDFRAWKEHDAYQKGFQRLLRDLKAEADRDAADKKTGLRDRREIKVAVRAEP